MGGSPSRFATTLEERIGALLARHRTLWKSLKNGESCKVILAVVFPGRKHLWTSFKNADRFWLLESDVVVFFISTVGGSQSLGWHNDSEASAPVPLAAH